MEGLQGDVVVVPGVGVGNLEGIETMTLDGEEVELARISCGDTIQAMYVPPDSLGAEGIREPMKKSRVNRVLELVEGTTAPKKRATWNRRRRRYQQTLIENEPEGLAAMLGELGDVRTRKTLSFHERRIFERVYNLLRDEIAAALGCTADTADQRLQSALPQPA